MAPRTTIDRLFDALAGLHNQVNEMKDDLRKDISAIDKSVTLLMDDRARASEQRRRTYDNVESARQDIVAVERKVDTNTALCAAMQEHISELKQTQDDYQAKKPLFAPALQKLEELDGRVAVLERADLTMAVNLEWWRRLGWLGWSVISGGAALVLAGLVSLGVNHLGPAVASMLDALRSGRGG